MYKVSITASVEKTLRKLDRPTRNRVAETLRRLATDPRPHGSRPIIAEPGAWRVRVGDWRIGYWIDDTERIVVIVRIARRDQFYSRG